jgi:sugar phosphate isomerase/epimerase
LQVGAATVAATLLQHCRSPISAAEPAKELSKFQIACMTLPYSQFPLERALSGIKQAGYQYVAWGTTHRESGGEQPVLAADAAPEKSAELARRCRDMGLEPVLMFSMIYPEDSKGPAVLEQRLRQAGAAKVPQVLTFGHTEGGKREVWIERLKKLAPIAADQNVILVVKQHGGSTGTGEACAEITREVGSPNVKVNYDAGNVMDYLNLDPLADVQKCADEVRSFCIKDHRNTPKDEDCGPGFGEIDHYKLLAPFVRTGRTIPLCCENIFAPLVPRPKLPEEVDALARRAREFLETVIQGLQAVDMDSMK